MARLIERFGLSGTNWTRKTSTLSALVTTMRPTPVSVISLSELVARCPYPMKQHQTLEASRWMVQQVNERLEGQEPARFQAFDRTPLDIMAFTMYAAERERKADSDPVLSSIEQ